MKKAFVCGAAVICALCLAGCGLIPTYGSGVVVSRSYDVSGFTAVSASDAVEVTVSIGEEGTFSVVASCEDNLIDYLQVSVANGVLTVGGFTNPVSTWYGAKVSVIMPAIMSVSASDASTVKVAPVALEGTFAVRASSASSIELEGLSADTVDIDVSDASHVEVNGASVADSLALDVSSASEARLYDLDAVDANVSVSDASDAQVRASGTLAGSVSSASSLRYKGECACTVEVEDVSCSCSHVAD